MRTLLVLLLFLVAAVSYGQEPASVEHVLTEYSRLQRALNSVKIEGITSERFTDSEMPGERWVREEMTYMSDGNRLDERTSLWFLNNEDDERSREPDICCQRLWDGNQWYQLTGSFRHAEGGTGDSERAWRVYINSEIGSAEEYRNVGDLAAPLLGRFPGDDLSVQAVIENAQKVALRPGLDRVGQVSCYVIDVESKQGQHTLWFDPEHGYNICRARCVKSEGDLWYGLTITAGTEQENAPGHDDPSQMGGGIEQQVFQFEVKNFIRVGDHWLPEDAEWEMERNFHDGRKLTNSMQHYRTKIELSPDFSKMDAFVPRIPEGTLVRREGDIVPMYWIGGHIVPKVDEQIRRDLERSVDKILEHNAVAAELEAEEPGGGRQEGGEETNATAGTHMGLVWVYASYTGALAILCVLLVVFFTRRKRGPR